MEYKAKAYVNSYKQSRELSKGKETFLETETILGSGA